MLSSDDAMERLLKTLYICVGCKVMLTCNLNVKFCLFNGSSRTVMDIIYPSGKFPKDGLPICVMVEFQQYTGPPFIEENPKLVLTPVQRKVDCFCYECKIIQIPLRLGWGTTIHRCQGMTIGDGESSRYIVINPGTRKFESLKPRCSFCCLVKSKNSWWS